MQKIFPCLWFDNQAEEAANYYVSLFPNSKIGEVARYDAAAAEVSGQAEGSVLTISFELDGVPFLGLNGGPAFKLSEAVSFVVNCQDQAEIDRYWEKLSAVPESEQCGWCKDKFGVSWQIVPENMSELVKTPGGMQAMLEMKKINIEELEKSR